MSYVMHKHDIGRRRHTLCTFLAGLDSAEVLLVLYEQLGMAALAPGTGQSSRGQPGHDAIGWQVPHADVPERCAREMCHVCVKLVIAD